MLATLPNASLLIALTMGTTIVCKLNTIYVQSLAQKENEYNSSEMNFES